MEASRAEAKERRGYLDFTDVHSSELVGMVASGVLALSLFLPWFATSEDNPNSKITSAGIGPGETASAWDTFPVLRWLLLAACIAPFILTWIIARGHSLTWRPGEVTMVVGMTAFVLILCNGIILGRPEPDIEISLSWGYLVALLGAAGLIASGYLRQAFHSDAKKPPGVL